METVETLKTDAENQLDQMKGKFVESLRRNNKKIRDDRALAIAESVQMIFKREVEDLELEIKKIKRERDNMLDLSPSTADSLVVASDLDAKVFVQKDLELGLKIRNLEIKMEIAKTRYAHLFN